MKSSTIERLRQLPGVFGLGALAARLNGDRLRAAQYAKRWRGAGLLESAGPKVGVYFNLVADPQSPKTRRLEALQLVFPEAVLCGETVLHDAGWTTQIPRLTQAIVLDRRTLPQLDGFELHRRPAGWYLAFRDDIDRRSFPRLTPGAALVDAWAYPEHKGMTLWRPEPDDLECDDIDWESLQQDFARHHVTWPSIYERPTAAPRLRMR